MAEPPFTLGMDVCGVVDAAGEGAEQWIGRRVVGITNLSLGGMAEAALVAGTAVFDAPPELDDVDAAAFTLPFHVSYLALHRRAALQAGEHLLVVGGASAVGTAAIQLGVAAGARVIGNRGRPGQRAPLHRPRRRVRDRPGDRRRVRPGHGDHRRPRRRRRVRCRGRRGHRDDLDDRRARRAVSPGRVQRRSSVGAHRQAAASRCRWATSRSSA